MVVHVPCKSLYIALPVSVKQQREMIKFCVVWRSEPRLITFKICISNLTLCSTTSFEINGGAEN